MLSLALQPAARVIGSVQTPALNYPASMPIPKPPLSKNQLYARPNTPSPHSKLISDLKISCENRRNSKISASAAAAVEAVEGAATEDSTSTQPEKKKLGVGVKQMQKPRIVLKFVWMEKNIGLGLDQLIPGQGIVPLSPYYFWPRKDAWEELKVLLESKPWISQKQMIILLNQATDIINLWQQSGGDLA